MTELTQKRLKELYYLNEDGQFVGLVKGTKRYNKIAGSSHNGLYISGINYSLSRLRELYRTGILTPRKSGTGKRKTHIETNEMKTLLSRAW